LAREDYPRVRVAFAGMPDDARGKFAVTLRVFNDSPGEARNVQVGIGARNLVPEPRGVGRSGSFLAGFCVHVFPTVPLLRHNHPKDLRLAGRIDDRRLALVEVVWQTDWDYGPKDQSRSRCAYGDIVLVHRDQIGCVYRARSEFADERSRVTVRRHSWVVALQGPTGPALAVKADGVRVVSIPLGPAQLCPFRGYVCDAGQTAARDGVVETDLAFLREQPATLGAPLGKVHRGERVRVRRWVGDWCYVEAQAAGAARGGWIAAWLIDWEQPADPLPVGGKWEGWTIIKEAVWADRPEESGLAYVP